MSWFAITLSILVITYLEIRRKSSNKKIDNAIQSTKKEIQFQLDLLNKMVGDGVDKKRERVDNNGARSTNSKHIVPCRMRLPKRESDR